MNNKIYAGLAIVFSVAAALNYSALQSFAFELAHVNFYLSFGFPVLIDVFIAIAVYISLHNKTIGEDVKFAWSIVILFTAASIYLNVLHYPQNIYGWSMAAVVPLVVFGAAELAKQQLEIKHKWDDTLQTIKNLLTQKEAAQKEVSDAQKLIDNLNITILSNKAEIASHSEEKAILEQEIVQLKKEHQETLMQLEKEKKEKQKEISTASDIPVKVLQGLQIDAILAAGGTKEEAAKLVKVGRNTVNTRLKLVNGQSLRKGM